MAEVHYTTGSISAVKDFLDLGAIFTTEKVSKRLAAICGCGALINTVIGIAAYQDDNSTELIHNELGKLDKKIGQLSDKMDGLFNDLKSFMSSSDFYKNEVSKIRTLTWYMKETMGNPCPDAKGLFRDAVTKNQPLWIAQELIAKLDQDQTNPLKMAMNNEPMKQTATFDKWRTIIDGVLAECLFLETYLNGMFWDGNMIGPNILDKQIKELNKKMDRWAAEYRRDRSYWDAGVLKMIENVQDKYEGNDNRAGILQKELDKIMTEHKFYAIVYDSCGGWDNHAFSHYHDNLICSFRRGGCNAVVFRSFKTEHCKWHAEELRRKLDASLPMPYINEFLEYVCDLRKKFGGECGFVGIIRKSKNICKRWVNCDPQDNPRGPGDFVEASTEKNFTLHESWDTEKFEIIAGYH